MYNSRVRVQSSPWSKRNPVPFSYYLPNCHSPPTPSSQPPLISKFLYTGLSYKWTPVIYGPLCLASLGIKFFFSKFLMFYSLFSSVAWSCTTLCNPMNRITLGLPVHHQLPEFTQTHVPWVGDAIQPSHPLSSPSPPALNLSQHQGPFKRVSSPHQVARVLEFQLQHQSFQWTPRTDLL